MNLSAALRFSLVLFLVFPFLFLLSQFEVTSSLDVAELWWAFKNSFVQAFFSALFAGALGFWVALGLIRLGKSSGKKRFLCEILCLLPNFLPPLFILLGTLNVLQPFPMGVAGVVIVHTIMNFGLAAVLFASVLDTKLGGVAELAYVEGVSRRTFYFRVLAPMLKKDLVLVGLFIFVICFGSFAVPLIVGGGKGTTMEVLIYEKIRLSNEWGEAVVIAFLQSSFIFALSFFASQLRGSVQGRGANLALIHSSSGLWVMVAISSLYIYGYVEGLVKAWGLTSAFLDSHVILLTAFLGSLLMGIQTGFFCYVLLLIIAFCWPKRWFENFLNGYVAPSTSLACFSLLILTPNESWYPYVKIPLALTFLCINSLFRMAWAAELEALRTQITVAYSMGASRPHIFREVMFPQVADRAGLLAGVAAVWACGDFAVSRILAHKDLTIAMMTETLMSGYRLHHAFVLSSLIVLAALICFVFFWGGSRVLSRKLTPRV